MPTKIGRIVRWGRQGPKFIEAFLDNGDRVELSPIAMEVVAGHDLKNPLVFVERRGRIFNYVHWVGTPDEAVRARDEGILRPDEIPVSLAAIGARRATEGAPAHAAPGSAWTADSVVDLDAARRRATADGNLTPKLAWLSIENPYFLLRGRISSS
jgi:hypothetical protein